MTERRTAKRYEISAPLSAWSSSLGYFQGKVRNISTSGVYIVSDRTVKEHEEFVILLKIPEMHADEDTSLLWAYCRAIRVEPASVGEFKGVGIAAVVDEYVMPSRRLAAGKALERVAA
jgi:hypothetical protein